MLLTDCSRAWPCSERSPQEYYADRRPELLPNLVAHLGEEQEAAVQVRTRFLLLAVAATAASWWRTCGRDKKRWCRWTFAAGSNGIGMVDWGVDLADICMVGSVYRAGWLALRTAHIQPADS